MKNLKPLTILHSNDLHGDFLAETVDEALVGGVSMLSGYINQTRESEKNTIYAIAGDMFRGSIIDSEYLGLSTIEIMNMLSPDIVTIGNHEIDYGIAHLLFIEKCAKFPIINANLFIKTNHSRLFNPCKILEVDDMKILFIGILTEDVLHSTKSDGLVGTFIDIEEAVVEIGKICNAYNTLDVDLTVLLTHIGFEEDKKLASLLDPAWGVDIIIGGHSHTLLEKACKVNDILIVQAGTGTDQIGRFDIQVNVDDNCIDSYTWKTVPINLDTCPVDTEMHDLITNYKNQTDTKYGRIVTRLKKVLTHPERKQETSLGNLIADAFRDSLGVDIMFVGSGSIRTEWLGPIVTLQGMRECYPYDGAIASVKLTGAQLVHIVKHLYRDAVWDGEHTEFYQVSKGVRITYNRSTKTLEKFDYNRRPINENKLYNVGFQVFHLNSAEEFFDIPLKEMKKNGYRIVTTSEFDVLEEYFSMHPLLSSDIKDRQKIID